MLYLLYYSTAIEPFEEKKPFSPASVCEACSERSSNINHAIVLYICSRRPPMRYKKDWRRLWTKRRQTKQASCLVLMQVLLKGKSPEPKKESPEPKKEEKSLRFIKSLRMRPQEKVLHFHLEAGYFHAIRNGDKRWEFRANNPYWKPRIAGATHCLFIRGFPAGFCVRFDRIRLDRLAAPRLLQPSPESPSSSKDQGGQGPEPGRCREVGMPAWLPEQAEAFW